MLTNFGQHVLLLSTCTYPYEGVQSCKPVGQTPALQALGMFEM